MERLVRLASGNETSRSIFLVPLHMPHFFYARPCGVLAFFFVRSYLASPAQCYFSCHVSCTLGIEQQPIFPMPSFISIHIGSTCYLCVSVYVARTTCSVCILELGDNYNPRGNQHCNNCE